MFSKKQYFPAFSLNRFLLHPISYLQIITNYRFSFLHGIFLLTCIHLLFTWIFWKFCRNLPNFMIMCKHLLMSLGCFVMFAIFLGCFAFFLFFLYDYNSILWQNKWLRSFFFLGCLLLVIATMTLLIPVIFNSNDNNWLTPIGLFFSILFFGLLIYTLFFALPFQKTYCQNNKKPEICQTGVYALCRHPGVLWFIGFYFSLCLMAPDPALLLAACLYSICNILYIIFQDKWTFPQQFSNYADYQNKTPFLWPTGRSLRQCICTLRKKV